MTATMVYMTAPNWENAEKIGKALLEDRLAACVNILDGMNSLYWWEGKIQKDSEVILIAKTRKDLIEALTQRVKTLHPYSCPCVVSWDLEGGNPDFFKWIEKETGKSS